MIHFITGDRSLRATYAIPAVAIEMLKLRNEDPTCGFATGDNTGVESAVALVGLATGINVTVVATPTDAEGGRDWDARHDALLLDPDTKITFLHTDPLTSHIGASLASRAQDRVTFVTPGVAPVA